MVRARPTLPEGHGEVIVQPPTAEWATLLTTNRERVRAYSFSVGGLPATVLSALVRRELLQQASGFSARMGLELREPGSPDAPIIMTGHQPELYHPGVWVKDFLVDRLAVELGATAVDVVVDTDGFDVIAVTAPCMNPDMQRCRQYLAVGRADGCYGSTPVPSGEDVESFCGATAEMLGELSAPAIGRHFALFCDALRESLPRAQTIAELVTFARRRYETSAATGYLEVPLTQIAATEGFRRFVAEVALNAVRFAETYNAELDEYRATTGVRSAAQPFPNLAEHEGAYELPLWLIRDGRRSTVWVRATPEGDVELSDGDGAVLTLPAEPGAAAAALADAGVLVAPKALVLTMFLRMFGSDLFVHGIGGGGYDRVTDAVIRRYFGVEPPSFGVASMTLYLPLGAHVVSAEEVSRARERLQRLEHNPDSLLGEVEFDSAEEQARARELAARKGSLVDSIKTAGADKKAIGARIRTVNAELNAALAPLRAEYERHLAQLESQLAAAEILTDRTYPFCFWDPREVADKVG